MAKYAKPKKHLSKHSKEKIQEKADKEGIKESKSKVQIKAKKNWGTKEGSRVTFGFNLTL